ncbi:MAG: hypothetical protein PVF89_06175 [Lysobacterales bacterium]|jgi:hypothetical protein
MNRRLRLFKCLLALLLVCSSALLSAHAANHVPSGSTTCVLCISHGNASNASMPATAVLFLAPPPAVLNQKPRTDRLVPVVFYRTPARAPPTPI